MKIKLSSLILLLLITSGMGIVTKVQELCDTEIETSVNQTYCNSISQYVLEKCCYIEFMAEDTLFQMCKYFDLDSEDVSNEAKSLEEQYSKVKIVCEGSYNNYSILFAFLSFLISFFKL